MRRKVFLLLPLSAIAVLLIAPGTRAGGGVGAKPPSPRTALIKAAKKLSKTPSYRTSFSLEGGISEQEDHKISKRTVGESYQGEVFVRLGPLMNVPQYKAYRLPKKGVAFIDGAWRNINSDQKTMRMDRLFKFPELFITRALRHSKTAKWLDAKPKEKKESTAKKSTKKKKRGSPTVARKGTDPEEVMAEWPKIVRIEVPPKEALQYFIEAQSSGCMSAG